MVASLGIWYADTVGSRCLAGAGGGDHKETALVVKEKGENRFLSLWKSLRAPPVSIIFVKHCLLTDT